MYILDQVRALESEMLDNIKKQGLEIEPKILVVCRILLLDKLDLQYLTIFSLQREFENFRLEFFGLLIWDGSMFQGNSLDSRGRGDVMQPTY